METALLKGSNANSLAQGPSTKAAVGKAPRPYVKEIHLLNLKSQSWRPWWMPSLHLWSIWQTFKSYIKTIYFACNVSFLDYWWNWAFWVVPIHSDCRFGRVAFSDQQDSSKLGKAFVYFHFSFWVPVVGYFSWFSFTMSYLSSIWTFLWEHFENWIEVVSFQGGIFFFFLPGTCEHYHPGQH